MYQLVSAIVKPLDGDGRWRSMDISDVLLRDLFNNYKRVVATLSNSVLPNNVSFDIEGLRSQLGGSDKRFSVWLMENGSLTLTTSNILPVINTRYAKFADAVHAGYTVTPVHPTISQSSNLPITERPDLMLTRESQDYELAYKNVLANVNGFYHKTDYSTDGLYVIDGMKTALHSNRNELGLLSFRELGELAFIPITDEMIYTQKVGEVLKNNCYIDTGLDLSQKTVMLVLGGYLHVLDKKTFYRISPASFGIDFGQIPLINRYYESFKVLNLASLGLEISPTNSEQISVPNLFSDAVLRKYLTLSQSFLVVLDNSDIFLDKVELKSSPFPGTYTSFADPVYPLIVGRGRHEVYWYRKEHDRYSVNINGSWGGVKNYSTAPTRRLLSVSDAELASLGYRNQNAHFLLIGSDV